MCVVLLPISGYAEMKMVLLDETEGKFHLTLFLNIELEYGHRYMSLPAGSSCMVLTAVEGHQHPETTGCVQLCSQTFSQENRDIRDKMETLPGLNSLSLVSFTFNNILKCKDLS